jgi:hypothetical protein
MLTNKNWGFTVTETNVFINQFTQFSAQVGDRQVILEERTNVDGMHINYIDSIIFC